eukprot:TRINITY_DN476_c0_g1_i1.p1 TRINITY_DN476_c0_g1~~TRINITY_DN476_c0_g1_i1.p1  ORF type:complete len:343 (+),score=89.97 TRINITY_DN476_c0_g1_i1:79-1029(+)
MSNAPWFGDLGKKAKDLLKKNYPTKFAGELEASFKANNDTTYKANINRDRKTGTLSGKLEDTVKFPDYNAEGTASFSTDSNEGSFVKLAWEPPQVRGLKTIIQANASSKYDEGKVDDKYSGTLQADYRAPYFSTSAFLKYIIKAQKPKDQQPVLGLNGVLAYEGFRIGGYFETKLPHNEEAREVVKYGLTLDYSSSDFSFTGYSQSEKDSEDKEKAILGVSYYHKVNDDLEVASDVFSDINQQDEYPVKISFGGAYRLDKYSTFRGKLDVAEGKLSLSYQQKLSDVASVTLGTELLTNHLIAGGGHKFGIGLNLTN